MLPLAVLAAVRDLVAAAAPEGLGELRAAASLADVEEEGEGPSAGCCCFCVFFLFFLGARLPVGMVVSLLSLRSLCVLDPFAGEGEGINEEGYM